MPTDEPARPARQRRTPSAQGGPQQGLHAVAARAAAQSRPARERAHADSQARAHERSEQQAARQRDASYTASYERALQALAHEAAAALGAVDAPFSALVVSRPVLRQVHVKA